LGSGHADNGSKCQSGHHDTAPPTTIGAATALVSKLHHRREAIENNGKQTRHDDDDDNNDGWSLKRSANVVSFDAVGRLDFAKRVCGKPINFTAAWKMRTTTTSAELQEVGTRLIGIRRRHNTS
jgi:hypothetical protein